MESRGFFCCSGKSLNFGCKSWIVVKNDWKVFRVSSGHNNEATYPVNSGTTREAKEISAPLRKVPKKFYQKLQAIIYVLDFTCKMGGGGGGGGGGLAIQGWAI